MIILGLILMFLVFVIPLLVFLFGILWAFLDKQKDKEEYEKDKKELEKY